MFAVKQTITNATFTAVGLTLIAYSFTQNWDGGAFKDYESLDRSVSKSQETYIKNVDYYLLKENKPYFSLKANELISNSSEKKTFFLQPDGHVFMESGEKVFYKGDKGLYLQIEDRLTLDKNVEVISTETTANSDKMIYEAKEDRVHLIQNVKTKTFFPEEKDWIFLDSDEAYLWPEAKRSRFAGSVAGHVKRFRVYEDSLYFWSDELYMDMNLNKADLHRDVRIKKQNLKATSRRGEIFFENYNNKLKYYALYDDVKLTERIEVDGKMINRKAFSEKLEGIPSEDKVILTGYPKVYQVNDVIKGNKIVLRQSTEVVEVDDANTKFEVE